MRVPALPVVVFVTILALAAQVHASDTQRGRSIAPGTKSQASGGTLAFGGTVSYHFDNALHAVVFDSGRLENLSTTHTSGEIKLRLVLTQSHIPPSLAFTYLVAAKIVVDPLPPGGYFPLKNLSLALAAVPDAVYYTSLVAFEKEEGCEDGDGYCADDVEEARVAVKASNGSYTLYGNPHPKAAAVEYFHSGFGHYFVTAQEDEIAALDGGAFGTEWSRTGETWNVWIDAPQTVDVCRFFTVAFAPKSSHFYTANAAECESIKANPAWIYEKIAFRVAIPDDRGACRNGIPLYRLYNDGRTGAPNHRYTTSVDLREAMIAQGFLPEDDNTVCVPP